jgi:hypothetical protein
VESETATDQSTPPVVFLDSTKSVDTWYDPATTPEPEKWPGWDETDGESSSLPSSFDAGVDEAKDDWPENNGPEDNWPENNGPEDNWPENNGPENNGSLPRRAASAGAWASDSASEDRSEWTPQAEVFEPATEDWAPDSSEYPAEPAVPETWTPETWSPEIGEPAAVEAEAEEEAEAPPTGEPFTQTLTAAIDILPQRASIRTALRRGRRKGDPLPGEEQPFNGGFDPIAPAREFARREGFGSGDGDSELASGLPAELTGAPTASEAISGLVPEPSRRRTGTPPERRQHQRNDEDSAHSGRSALASEALTELSRLSAYSPTSMPSGGKAGLQRRTPSEVPVQEPEPAVAGSGDRARTAASVRSMLAGFKAGVERGRTSPAANRSAPPLPPPPRNSPPDDPR